MTTHARELHVYDATLTAGAEHADVSFSIADKLTIAKYLDDLGVEYIEGGYPGALGADRNFFARAADELRLKHAGLVAGGVPRATGVAVSEDPQVNALVDSHVSAWSLTVSADPRHVSHVHDNLAALAETVAYGVDLGKRVFVECAHFFDAIRFDAAYAVDTVRAAFDAGADVVVLNDTNGGALPSDIDAVFARVRKLLGHDRRLGVACRNDSGCAVANTVTAIQAGAVHVRTTANGYGERLGNADLFTVVGNVHCKLGLDVLATGGVEKLTSVSAAIAETANLAPNPLQPYVGLDAFAHKSGPAPSVDQSDPALRNHVDPGLVGNNARVLVGEMAGKTNVALKARELGVDLSKRPDAWQRVTERVKNLQDRGWSFEAADASFELLVRDEMATGLSRKFVLDSYRVIVEHRTDATVASEATVKLRVDGERVITTAEGNGPVHALDNALRKALKEHYPQLDAVALSDYKVRILSGSKGTDAATRVLVETTDGRNEWTTVGVDDNVVEASWNALAQSLTYRLSVASAQSSGTALRAQRDTTDIVET